MVPSQRMVASSNNKLIHPEGLPLILSPPLLAVGRRLGQYPLHYTGARKLSQGIYQMGCIPSKQKVLDGDSSTTVLSGAKERKQKKQKKDLRLASPVIGDDAAPWLKERAILRTHKDGTILITERDQPQ
ncbi:hypothetical protein C2E23DRAFT_802565 [Lenzites betulinus]|nr:hypothetical protein C2E23DRAFT_802565 [Lenzites betulinus]